MSADAPVPDVVPHLPVAAPAAPPAPAQEKDYPLADFIDPVEWNWSEDAYEVDRALKEWSEQTHADD